MVLSAAEEAKLKEETKREAEKAKAKALKKERHEQKLRDAAEAKARPRSFVVCTRVVLDTWRVGACALHSQGGCITECISIQFPVQAKRLAAEAKAAKAEAGAEEATPMDTTMTALDGSDDADSDAGASDTSSSDGGLAMQSATATATATATAAATTAAAGATSGATAGDAAADDDDADSADDADGAAMPVQLIHHFVVVPAKQRLVALVGALLGLFANGASTKVLVFFATCDSVDFHYELFAAAAKVGGGAFGVSPEMSGVLRLHGQMNQQVRVLVRAFSGVCVVYV